LIILWIARLLRFFTLFVRDISSLERGPALFTIVAGTCILGSEFVLFSGNFTAGLSLWIAGTVLWFFFFYAFFAKVIVGETDLSFVEKFDEGWLIYAVGTQSVSLLSTLIAPGYPAQQETFLLFALLMYLLGGALYLLLIVLILYRLLFFSLPVQKLTPLYWISMGAGAITTLSGATLLLNSTRWTLLKDMIPFLSGLTLSSWAVTTWWIPLLTVLYVWRHAHMRFPVLYDVQYWCMVFPFGMYAYCTLQLGTATGLKALPHISIIFFYVALTVWAATLFGLLRVALRILFRRG
jgi:tellurite resistance protein TehA-like permease